MKNKTNILILGGLGFIGRNLVEELLANDSYSIIVFDSKRDLIQTEFGAGKFKFYTGNFNIESDIDKIFKENKIDIVIHLISSTVPQGFCGEHIINDIESNLVPTVRLLELMKKYEVRKIIFASSGGTIYGLPLKSDSISTLEENHQNNPICSHGVIKLTIEKYLYLYHYLHGIEYLILRIANPYGEYHSSNSQGLINVSLKNIVNKQTVVVWGNGEVVRDYIYIKDCVKIISALIEKGVVNKTLNIGSGIGLSINEIIAKIKKITGDFDFKMESSRQFDVPRAVLNIDELKSIINFIPTDIETGITNTYKWLLKK